MTATPSLCRDSVRSEAQGLLGGTVWNTVNNDLNTSIETSGPLLLLPQIAGPSAYKQEFGKFFSGESDQPKRKHLKPLTSELLQ